MKKSDVKQAIYQGGIVKAVMVKSNCLCVAFHLCKKVLIRIDNMDSSKIN